MKRLFQILITMLIIGCYIPVFAAGSWTIVSSGSDPGTDLRWIHYQATADASDGSVPDYTVTGFSRYFLYTVETWPGSPSPTDATDLTLSDAVTGEDLLGGNGTDGIDATSPLTLFCYSPGMDTIYTPPIKGNLTIGVTNNSVNSAIINVRITGGK